MSFSNGFQKTAGLGGLVGTAGGTAAKAGKTVATEVKQFAQKQRADRVSNYRAAATGKLPFGKGDLGKQKKALGRLDKMKATSAKNSQSFASKHPFLTAGGVALGAKALLGGGDQQQQPTAPPQIVQY